jgi:hypothetical protein
VPLTSQPPPSAKICQPTGPTVRRQSRYAEDSGVHPTSGIDWLEKSEREEEEEEEEEEEKRNDF